MSSHSISSLVITILLGPLLLIHKSSRTLLPNSERGAAICESNLGGCLTITSRFNFYYFPVFLGLTQKSYFKQDRLADASTQCCYCNLFSNLSQKSHLDQHLIQFVFAKSLPYYTDSHRIVKPRFLRSLDRTQPKRRRALLTRQTMRARSWAGHAGFSRSFLRSFLGYLLRRMYGHPQWREGAVNKCQHLKKN